MGAMKLGFDNILICDCVCSVLVMQGVGGVGLTTKYPFLFLFLYNRIRDIGGMILMSIVLNYVLFLSLVVCLAMWASIESCILRILLVNTARKC